jgi:hypothetical protein
MRPLTEKQKASYEARRNRPQTPAELERNKKLNSPDRIRNPPWRMKWATFVTTWGWIGVTYAMYSGAPIDAVCPSIVSAISYSCPEEVTEE